MEPIELPPEAHLPGWLAIGLSIMMWALIMAIICYLNSGAIGNSERVFHFTSLPIGSSFSVFTKLNGSPIQLTSIDSQSERNSSQSSSNINQPPFTRRIVAAIFGFIGGFYLYDRGLRYFYDRRKFFGSALISLGIFLVLSSLCLWLFNGFRWSWGWWI